MGCVDCCGAHYTTALPPLPTSWERLLAQVAYTILCSYTFLYETKGNKCNDPHLEKEEKVQLLGQVWYRKADSIL